MSFYSYLLGSLACSALQIIPSMSMIVVSAAKVHASKRDTKEETDSFSFSRKLSIQPQASIHEVEVI
jgi:hypothetical protein